MLARYHSSTSAADDRLRSPSIQLLAAEAKRHRQPSVAWQVTTGNIVFGQVTPSRPTHGQFRSVVTRKPLPTLAVFAEDLAI